MAKLFEGAVRNWKFVVKFLLFSGLFWLVQFAYQFYFYSAGDIKISLVRSFAFSGATFIALALLSSSIFRFIPQLSKHANTRRSLGVSGTFFIILHVLTALGFVFNFNLGLAYYSLNPLLNPVVFGALALPIFLVLSLISTDWAVQKLGAKWKMAQRLVYFGFMLAIFHFIKQAGPAIMSLPGIFLLVLTTLALAGELYWFVRTTIDRKKITIGTLIGFAIILLYLVLGYLSFFSK